MPYNKQQMVYLCELALCPPSLGVLNTNLLIGKNQFSPAYRPGPHTTASKAVMSHTVPLPPDFAISDSFCTLPTAGFSRLSFNHLLPLHAFPAKQKLRSWPAYHSLCPLPSLSVTIILSAASSLPLSWIHTPQGPAWPLSVLFSTALHRLLLPSLKLFSLSILKATSSG